MATAAPPKKDAAPEAAKTKPRPAMTQAQFLAQVEALPPDAVHAKYKPMTNAQVAAVLRYQVSREDAKPSDALTPEQAKLARAAARVYAGFVDGLGTPEKRALGEVPEDELVSDEERARFEEKPGLKALARWRWITTGQSTAAQAAEGRAKGGDAKPAKTSKPRTFDPGRVVGGQADRRLAPDGDRWAECAYERLSETPEGIVVIAFPGKVEDGGGILLGQFPTAENGYYDHIQGAIKKAKLDPAKVTLVTHSARVGYVCRAKDDEERVRPRLFGVSVPAAK